MPNEPDSPDPWVILDELTGAGSGTADVESDIGPVAFYGRCSTEDNQDPRTSRAWQRSNAAKFVEALGGVITEDYFDIGQSRSVPWDRRREGARLLAALKDPGRTWTAVVVGEGTRCWFGNQFSLIAPRFAAYGVDLWVPELGGKFDARNPSHKMLMSVLGGMSESERQHVQARVRAAMDAQVVNEGRHQGGRAPHGYKVVDGGPHPNPRKAAEGFRLRVLAIDEDTAPAVRRIFREYLAGAGDRMIAGGLNRDGVPCPSSMRPEQNRHRLADGWQGSTVRSILENPRYTGYAVFGRWTKTEMLADPDDVAAGHVTRFRRAAPEDVVRSRKPAHPAIVSVEDFTRAQVVRRSRGAGGMAGIAKLERSGSTPPKRLYLLRGRVRCEVCKRKMQGGAVRQHAYYRCKARTLAPGSLALADHPTTVNLREDIITGAINGWVGELFAPENRDATVHALVASQCDPAELAADRAVNKRLADAETALKRYQAAIAAGVEPSAVVDAINQARAERDAARAHLAQPPDRPPVLDTAEVYAMIDALGDVGSVIERARPERLARLYQELDLGVRYLPADDGGVATLSLRVASECVRGGT
ncbi:recombinase family protein [Pseudonocardia sp. S2-4]|uniref:Recombinase family protein n=2 Tax=Pseudonocardia humida TaxID=2800819 RepID=A0ABT1A359_9PSEU|nr:recombinase family protein [Pseudonocardia humida]